MPSVATGANLANKELYCIGISGDGDTASIGMGQFAHIVRRRINMCYIVDNNGTYGLTKGQFSATNDQGSTSKKGAPNLYEPIDLVSMALQLGATFVARSFSGDKGQLVPLIKAGLLHKGFAFIDVISPCVAFNNHDGSTKSYDYVRDHRGNVVAADFVAAARRDHGRLCARHARRRRDARRLDVAAAEAGTTTTIRTTASRRSRYVQRKQDEGEVVTGLLYLDPDASDCHAILETVDTPLNALGEAELCPGNAALKPINASFR